MTTPLQKNNFSEEAKGILLVNKPVGKTSFSLVGCLRKRLGVKKIGHAGTLDPFASGVMVMLIGREYTRLSDKFLCQDKEYEARIYLGESTDTFDCEGKVLQKCEKVPSLQEIEEVSRFFQGEISQIPPMFSAKKIGGKKLYELARKGQVIERSPVKIIVQLSILQYDYPHLDIRVCCSKGTYIRSIADDFGKMLGCFGHLSALKRVRSGEYHIDDCIDGTLLQSTDPANERYLKTKLRIY
jgi:tRNA pseudouridine55 synthase